MRRNLILKRETLTELTGNDLSSVVGAAAGNQPTYNCTLPVNECILSLNPCYYSEYPSCQNTE